MQKIGAFVLAAAIAGTSACATHPNNIQAAYVSPIAYSNYSCDQLRFENDRLGRRVSQVTGQQAKRASDDSWALGVGLVLFWPALFFMANGDQKEELSRLKGEHDALQAAVIQKQCGQPQPAPELIPRPAGMPIPAAPAATAGSVYQPGPMIR